MAENLALASSLGHDDEPDKDNEDDYLSDLDLFANDLHTSSLDGGVVSEGTPSLQLDQGPTEEVECEVCLLEAEIKARWCCHQIVCDSCVKEYISQKIHSGQVLFACPALDCSSPVSPEEVKEKITDATLLEKYDRFLAISKMDPNIKTCLNCSVLTEKTFTSVDKYGHVINCEECGYAWCFECQGRVHEGVKCKDSNDRKALRRWMKKTSGNRARNARECPKCTMLIQKSDGCFFMTCSACHTYFCYACGVTLTEADHHEHNGEKCHRNRHLHRLMKAGKVAGIVIGAPLIIVSAVGLLVPVGIAVATYKGCDALAKRLKEQRQRKNMDRKL